MKKFLALIAVGAMLIAVSGCNNNPESTTTSTAATSAAAETTVSGSLAGDDGEPVEFGTSQEVIDYLKERVPYYAQFVETRCSIPLTYETLIDTSFIKYRTAYYIADNTRFAAISVDQDGVEDRMVYKDGVHYDVYGGDKIIYYRNPNQSDMDDFFKMYMMTIDLEQAKSCEYTSGEAEYKGVMYKHETLSVGDKVVNYYFDMDTGKLCYIQSGFTETEIVTLENSVDESNFDVPTDYEMVHYQDYIDSVAASSRAEESKNAATATSPSEQ